jgi:hypothetical protein
LTGTAFGITLGVSATSVRSAVPESILPPSFLCLLAAFSGCFHAPSYANFRLVVAGWVHCLGRRTVTGVVLAAGGVGGKHISAFHRFFGRATWALDAVGKVVFELALRWLPADQPLYLLGDDTLARCQSTPAGRLSRGLWASVRLDVW